MIKDSLDIELIDFMDLLDETFSSRFVDKWKFKYSIKFLRLFQMRLLKAMNDQKPIKLDSLSRFFIKKHHYSENQVNDFFESIEIDLYYPLILA